MRTEANDSQLDIFQFETRSEPVVYVETMEVTSGVRCDVYNFPHDPSKDLGIIVIDPGQSTPRQRVLKGTRTVEGYISGEGSLEIKRTSGEKETWNVGKQSLTQLTVDVNIGDEIQWRASLASGLLAFEVCFPPYQDGRYEVLE